MYLRLRTSEACFAGLDSLIKIMEKAPGEIIEAFPTTEMIAAFTISYGERMDTEAVLAGFSPMVFANADARLHGSRTSQTSQGDAAAPPGQESSKPNFVSINVRQFNTMEPAPPYERNYEHDIHNYSIQTLSTTARQMQALRRTMAKDRTHVYSYGGAYLSQLVPRVDYDAAVHKAELERRKKWQTPAGFSVSS
ncbi:hypothetical protein HDU86_002399 [Geranomyces michiganensis]|nr:hypothetical protein HDU86_002399 [Geranomyces michiganensis]